MLKFLAVTQQIHYININEAFNEVYFLKTFIIALPLIFSWNAYASADCPNLTGTYLCGDQAVTNESDKKILAVTQFTENDITTYVMNVTQNEKADSSQIVADNKEYPYHETNSEFAMDGFTKTTCSDNKLLSYDVGAIKTSKNIVIDNFDYLQTINLNSDSNFVISNIGKHSYQGEIEPVNETETCVRLQP
jgi:hypothetical protein